MNTLALLTGLPNWSEMIIVAIVGLLLFGKRLPDVARSLGKSVVEFKKGIKDIKSDVDGATYSQDRSIGNTPPPPPLPQNPPASDANNTASDNKQ